MSEFKDFMKKFSIMPEKQIEKYEKENKETIQNIDRMIAIMAAKKAGG